MARDGCSYDSSSSTESSESPLPLHLCFFFLILLLFLGFSWYLSYEPVLENAMDNAKLLLVVSPLVLLIVVHWISSDRPGLSCLIPLPEKGDLHRAGSTPWGLGFVLVFLLFMVWYQSHFQERWFPLLSK